MITLLTGFFKSFFKYILLGVIAVILFFYIKSKLNEIAILKADNTRQTENLAKKNFEVTVEKTKSGQLSYSVDVLIAKVDELTFYNDKIVERLTDMGLKIKNIKTVTNVENHYAAVIDTINSKMINENKFLSTWSKNNMEISGYINIPKGYPNFKIPTDFSVIDTTASANYPYLSGVKVFLKDDLLIAHEIQYKKVWIFWKKPTGVKLHIQSTSPNFNLDRIQTFGLKK